MGGGVAIIPVLGVGGGGGGGKRTGKEANGQARRGKKSRGSTDRDVRAEKRGPTL